MQVKNKIMYHYHNKDIYSDIWQVGNEITVDDNFMSDFCMRLQHFSTAVEAYNENDEKVLSSFDKILEGYLDKDRYKNLSDELIYKLFTEASGIIRNTNLCHGEYMLERYRKFNYPHLPSRYHSIWVTDENSLEFWESKLNATNYLKLCKLQLTGELFKSSDTFLLDSNLTLSEMYEQSERYWNPDFSIEESNERVEYLFQGKAKILEMKKIK